MNYEIFSHGGKIRLDYVTIPYIGNDKMIVCSILTICHALYPLRPNKLLQQRLRDWAKAMSWLVGVEI